MSSARLVGRLTPGPSPACLVCPRPHCRVLLWRRSDNVVFALLLGGADLVVVGDGVECKVKGILQVRPANFPAEGHSISLRACGAHVLCAHRAHCADGMERGARLHAAHKE